MAEKDKYCTTYMWSHKKSEYNKKEILTDIDNKLVVISGKRGGGGKIQGWGLKGICIK